MNFYHSVHKVKDFIGMSALIALPVSASQNRAADLKPADWVDPRIGNVSQFLMPTYPAFHQPNLMLRIFPIRENYIMIAIIITVRSFLR